MSEPVVEPVAEPVVEPVVEPVPEGPLILIRLEDLINDQAVIANTEAADRAQLDKIENPDFGLLRQALIRWAVQGFPHAFPVFSITLQKPAVCSDGNERSLYPYVEYLCGMTIADKMKRLEAKLEGIALLNSYSGNTLTFHVTKA